PAGGGCPLGASVLPGSSDPPPGHPPLAADPPNPAFVYAIWDGHKSAHSDAAVFARTTDGGSNWEPPRAIVQTAAQSFIQFSQIFVLPNGTLVDLYEFYAQQPNGPITQTSLQLLRSADHGQSWSTLVNAVTMTPLDVPPTNRQSFLPSIAVAANGTIGVSYYDFRFNTPNPGLPTDRWLVQCHPSPTGPATNPACWSSEVRLTTSSFNMEAVVP